MAEKKCRSNGEGSIRQRKDDRMAAAIRHVLPMARVPTRDELWAEYGLDARTEAC